MDHREKVFLNDPADEQYPGQKRGTARPYFDFVSRLERDCEFLRACRQVNQHQAGSRFMVYFYFATIEPCDPVRVVVSLDPGPHRLFAFDDEFAALDFDLLGDDAASARKQAKTSWLRNWGIDIALSVFGTVIK